ALRLLAALTAALSWGGLALWWAGRGSRREAPLGAVIDALCGLFWAWAAGFQILALAHGFALGVVVPTWVALPAAAAWAAARPIARELARIAERWRAELRELVAELRRHPWIGLAVGAIGLEVAVLAATSLVTPTFGWDDFTYHLQRAARWVQASGIALDPA